MRISLAGGVEAWGAPELLFTIGLLGRVLAAPNQLWASPACRTKATSRPLFDNKLLLVYGRRRNKQPREVPSAVGLVLAAGC